MSGYFRKWFWQPPRAHGDTIEDRSVSFLELFYDLVYVVVVARAAHTLADDVSLRSVTEFAVIFALIWIGWVNGSVYYDLHGREDGRTRTLVFAQMLLLALLAVYTSGAATGSGREFAVVYTIFLAFLTSLWYGVRRQDSEEYGPVTARYLTSMVVATVTIGASIFLEPSVRIWVWATYAFVFIASFLWIGRTSERRFSLGIVGSDSLVERFGLFTIIVLGEVVVGVVDGLAATNQTPLAVATGVLGLTVGFAFWWSYFDFAGRRLPADRTNNLYKWMLAHLPVTMSIAATGAAMVSMVEHADDPITPVATAWLMTGGIGVGLLALVILMWTLRAWERFPEIYRRTAIGLMIATAAVLLVGWWRPAPWLLTLSIIAILSAVWMDFALRLAQSNDPKAIIVG